MLSDASSKSGHSQDDTTGADMSGAPRQYPRRTTQPPLGQLQIEYERVKEELERALHTAAKTTEVLAVTQVLTVIDALHTELYLMFSKLKRAFNKTGTNAGVNRR